MPFDSLTMAAAAHDAAQLIGGKLNKIHQPDKYSLLLRFFTPEGSFKLLLSAHPTAGRVQLTGRNYANPTKPPLFCMVLRKHLDSAKLTAVCQPPGERVLRLDFAAHNEIGEETRRTLVLEVMGKHSNLILLDSDAGLIIDAARRYSHNVSRYREVLPGVPYLPPPPSAKPLLYSFADEEALAAALLAGDLSLPPDKLLLASVSGVSPYLARELCLNAGLDLSRPAEELGAYDFSRLYAALQKLAIIIEEKRFQPVLLGGADFYALPPADGRPCTAYPTMSAALDAFYQAREEAQEFAGERARLQKLLNREQQRLTKKLKLEEADYAEALSAEKYKNAGDLLTAYLHLAPPGAAEVELPDFYEPDKSVKIALQPELSAADNAKRFFHRYNKAKKAERQLKEQIAANRDELLYVESLQNALLEAENLPELAATRQEMQAAGYLKRGRNEPKPRSDLAASAPKRYRTSDGFIVWLGRNNRQNDRLTTKMAAPEDIWLHAQKIPGSHVILRHENGRDFTETALLEAAALAAAHSQARAADKVPVDHTTVKNVKKPNGAKPGMVIYFEQQTLYVAPRELAELTDHKADPLL